MKIVTVLLCIVFITGFVAKGGHLHRRMSLLGRTTFASSRMRMLGAPPPYETKYFEQSLDHFNVAEDRTFQQRYLYSGEKWDGKGPLFVYTGNEGDITWFYNNTVSIYICYCGHFPLKFRVLHCAKIARFRISSRDLIGPSLFQVYLCLPLLPSQLEHHLMSLP